jgi:hypothetical protein
VATNSKREPATTGVSSERNSSLLFTVRYERGSAFTFHQNASMHGPATSPTPSCQAAPTTSFPRSSSSPRKSPPRRHLRSRRPNRKPRPHQRIGRRAIQLSRPSFLPGLPECWQTVRKLPPPFHDPLPHEGHPSREWAFEAWRQ